MAIKVQDKIVSIVIVTRGVNNYLRLCLDSIRQQAYRNLEIIVVDNSVNNNFSQGIISNYPDIKLYIIERDNTFYAQALNKGIEASKGDLILCLNDDVILEKGFIQQAKEAFYRDSRVGIVSPKVLRSDRVTIDSTGLFLTLWRTARERGYATKDNNRLNAAGYIFGVNSSVVFYRRQMLENIKIDGEYFDTDFRIFYEDLDVAWRSNLLGWKAYYTPAAVAYHVRGGTVRQGSGINKPYARRYLSDELHLDLIKNRYLCLIKNETAFGFLSHLPFILLYDFIVLSYLAFYRPSLFKRLPLNLKYLKSSLRKRKLIRNRRRKLCQSEYLSPEEPGL